MNLSLFTRAGCAAALALCVAACTTTESARNSADSGSNTENATHRSSGGGGEAAIKPARQTFDARHTVTVKVPEGTKQIKAWFAVPQFDDPAQTVSNFVVRAPWPTFLVRDGAGNVFLYLEKDNPGTSEFNVTTEFTVTRTEINANIDASKTRPLTEAELKAMAPYLQGGKQTVVDDKVKAKAFEIVGTEKNPIKQAKLIYDWVLNNVEYWVKDPKNLKASGVGSSAYCMEKCTGNCTDFHALYVALCIASNLPTRVFYGSFFKTSLDGKDADQSYHCWVEFYAPEIGWIPLDVAAADIFVKDLKINDDNKNGVNLTVPDGYKGPDEKMVEYYFGNLEARRVTWHMNRDLVLNPKQAGEPANWLPKAYIEIDGKTYAEGKDTWARKLTFKERK